MGRRRGGGGGEGGWEEGRWGYYKGTYTEKNFRTRIFAQESCNNLQEKSFTLLHSISAVVHAIDAVVPGM